VSPAGTPADTSREPNVAPHDESGMKVCLVDGNDGAPFACTSHTFTSIDG
jgi:hypothetical protein